jgi:N6-adenosine-specific RNA methylase IME4
MIVTELCGDLPRIELFARQKAEGWDSWGNEV